MSVDPDAVGENHFHGSVAQAAEQQDIAVFMPEDVNLAASFSHKMALTSGQVLSLAR
ncbi:MAG: hypothetical protein WBW72_19645 [Erwinia billingiae]